MTTKFTHINNVSVDTNVLCDILDEIGVIIDESERVDALKYGKNLEERLCKAEVDFLKSVYGVEWDVISNEELSEWKYFLAGDLIDKIHGPNGYCLARLVEISIEQGNIFVYKTENGLVWRILIKL